MARTSNRRFSPGWVVISYFLICGGIVAGIIGVVAGLRAADMDPRVAGYLACGGGGLLGGFFAGRASDHFSILEPAVAGALVVGSVFALIKYTAIGPLAFVYAEDTIVRESLVLGGLAFGGGMAGALLGELSATGGPSRHPLRWLGLSVFLTAGALLATTIAAHVFLVDRRLRDGEFMLKLWRQETPAITGDELVWSVLAALAGAALLGGLVTQLAAPARMLVVSSLGAPIAIGGALAGLFVLGGVIHDQDVILSLVLLAAGAWLLGLLGALAGWLFRRVSASAPAA